MNENEKTAAINPSAPTDEKQPSETKPNTSIPEKTLMHNGKIIAPLETVDGKSLLGMELPPLKFTTEEILPQGLFILAGSPKIGKSWLSLDFCQTVATGGKIWDYHSEQGEVLYLALEDRLKRLQDRLRYYSQEDTPGISNIHFAIRALKIQDGLVAQISEFIERHPNTVLLVIDTMQNIRNNGNDKNAYVSDYRDMNILREITDKYEITLLLVHHNRKQDDPDPINMISGSTGLVGATDGAFILERKERMDKSARLTISNRDTEDFSFQLMFDDNCRWQLIGTETPEDKDEPLLKVVADFLKDTPNWSGTATELCELLYKHDSSFGYEPPVISKK